MNIKKPKAVKGEAGAAGIEYHGVAGSSLDCQYAVVRLLQFGDAIVHGRIVSFEKTHGILLTKDMGDQIAIKTGFATGYGGTGPTCFSETLQLLSVHGCEIDECDVSEQVLNRLDQSALTLADLDSITTSKPVRPSCWYDYILKDHFDAARNGELWREFKPVIPYSLIDSRIFDLALSFWKDPDGNLMKGYRRLEDAVRQRTGSNEYGQRVFSAAFHGNQAVLGWSGIDSTEKIGRGNLFVGTYMAHRNPRSHSELERDSNDQLAEFLLLNHLFRLEKESVKLEVEAGQGTDKT